MCAGRGHREDTLGCSQTEEDGGWEIQEGTVGAAGTENCLFGWAREVLVFEVEEKKEGTVTAL